METAQALSKTARRLSNEELGSLQRRMNEIVRRVEEGNIELSWVMGETQRVIEGKKIPEMVYRARAEPLEFKRPPKAERRRSKAQFKDRLPSWRTRLDWPQRNNEHVMAEMWEAECIPRPWLSFGRTPINAIMGEGVVPTPYDVQVISSTLQWLGTNVGQEFLGRYIRVAQMWVA